MNIYVSVGTHEQPFQRLLNSVADAVAQFPDNRWVIQYGVGIWSQSHQNVINAVDYFTPDKVSETLDWADVMISQASPGNVFGALEAGVWPLVLGRRHAKHEHVDDHQVRFAAALASMGLATDIVETERLGEVIIATARTTETQRAELIEAGMRSSFARQQQFRQQAWPLILGSKAERV